MEEKDIMEYLNEPQDFCCELVQMQTRKVDDFIANEISKEIKMSVGVYVDKEKVKKWAKMCIDLENMSREQIENIKVRHYVEKLENKCKRVFEILKDYDLFTLSEQDEPELYCISTYDNVEYLTKEEYELIKEIINYEK